MAYAITWIGQGGFILGKDNFRIVIDPYLSYSLEQQREPGKFVRLFPPPILPADLKANLLLATHDHIDHLDEETIRGMDWTGTLFGGPGSCIYHLEKIGIPKESLILINRGESKQVGPFKIHALFADHTEDSIGLIFETENLRVYFVGDSLYNEDLKKAAAFQPDILICCINGRLGNMHYNEAALLAKEIGVKIAIPCHYGLFADNTEDPRKFQYALRDSPVHYRELTINQPTAVSTILDQH